MDEQMQEKVIQAMKMLARAEREGIDILLRDDLRVLIGMPVGEPAPKWLTNEMFALSNRIVLCAMAARAAVRATMHLQDTVPEPEEVTASPDPKPLMN